MEEKLASPEVTRKIGQQPGRKCLHPSMRMWHIHTDGQTIQKHNAFVISCMDGGIKNKNSSCCLLLGYGLTNELTKLIVLVNV